MQQTQFDYVIVGAGVGGLFSAALLAQAGHRVCVLERHYMPGGYGHSFRRGDYTFCAQLHYLWNCGPDDDMGRVLRRLELDREIRFRRLDPNGFDRLNFPSFRYRIVQGFDRNLECLAQRYPAHRQAVAKYFATISAINRELLQLPVHFDAWSLLAHPLRFRHILGYRNWTTQRLFESLGLPLEIRSILAGQSGDLLLPPSQASLLAQAGLVCGYDSGAYVPASSYEHLFRTLMQFINSRPGCRVRLKTWVVSLETESGRVVAARTLKGERVRGRRFIHNGDPQLLAALVDGPLPRRYQRTLQYEYSASSFTLYLGVRDLDLRNFGFGNWNVWHYADDDVNVCYRRHLQGERMDNPSLFMSTPTLHAKENSLTPPGCQQLVVCAPSSYDHFRRIKQQGRRAYLAEKERITGLILDQIERHYVPGLRKCLDLVVSGTPTTNERFVLAPQGNAYGAKLTPRQLNLGKVDCRTPLKNLWLVGATASVPGFAAGVHFALLLYEYLTGDKLHRRSPGSVEVASPTPVPS